MNQIVSYWIEDKHYIREVPPADGEVMPGLNWGKHGNLFTPAYWLSQYWMAKLDEADFSPYKTTNLIDEIVFCMLGGFGITADLSMAAFQCCKSKGLIDNKVTVISEWENALSEKLEVNGRLVKYRYPKQKSKYLASAMQFISNNDVMSLRGKQLRDELLKINGVGYKTAGWIARNFSDADDVAILDIHLVRAGVICGFFNKEQRVERDYMTMEKQFIDFCHAIGTRPSVLDCLIWDQMRDFGGFALDIYNSMLGTKITVKKPIQNTPSQLQLFSNAI
ncbi:hypothetical protein [Pseudoalteromonas sp. Of7M-16]|uniref:8-oxoguanine DNA glycosylase n=1 Tax=Pseudoalteromonas sp. Of7M-16 TaxID=2917756 RepID=UPI001EF69127|nr:hypothetical protein [Pseudoalteromonas sp. Of7M-16]MCG7548792.1 hypothetical protein [Pseudoalteromonas sp. Of7M-16]